MAKNDTDIIYHRIDVPVLGRFVFLSLYIGMENGEGKFLFIIFFFSYKNIIRESDRVFVLECKRRNVWFRQSSDPLATQVLKIFIRSPRLGHQRMRTELIKFVTLFTVCVYIYSVYMHILVCILHIYIPVYLYICIYVYICTFETTQYTFGGRDALGSERGI